MPITACPFSGEADAQRMIALACAFPADHLHWIDLPYRLSSWALDDPANIALWVDDDGTLRAWAVLQAPFWTIDCACDPHAEDALPQLWAWADQRARAAAGTLHGHPFWFANVLACQPARIRALEAAGFVPQADVGANSWTKVLMRLDGSPAAGALPDGFSLRPLGGPAEVDAYVQVHQDAFGTTNMTAAWRARTLRRPEYRADLDMVVAAPDGRLAAFCIGWLARDAGGRLAGQIEPLGVRAEFRQLGLGRAALLAVLHRLHAAGAAQIIVETDKYRDAALGLYADAGFRAMHDVLVFRKEFAAGSA